MLISSFYLPPFLINPLSYHSSSIPFKVIPKFTFSLLLDKTTVSSCQNLTKKLKITSQIRSLTLTINFAGPLQINTILHVIKSSKDLQELSLNFATFPLIPFQQIGKAMRSCKRLRKFQFNISTDIIAGKNLDSLAFFLSKIPSFARKVTEFKVTCPYPRPSLMGHPAATNFFPTMAKGFKSLTSLTLDLSLIFFWDLRKGASTFDFSSLKHLKNLSYLNIIFSNQETFLVRNHNAQSLPYHSFRKLQHLKISIHRSFYTFAKGLISFTSRLATNLPQLQTVSLILNFTKSLPKEDLGSLTDQLALGIKYMTSLSLTIPELSFTTQVVLCLSSLLFCEKLQILQALEMDFSHCKDFSNFAMQELVDSIGKNLINIKRLSFSLSMNPNYSGRIKKVLKTLLRQEDLSDKGLVQFGKALAQKTSSLEYLRLDIEQCSQISDKGVKELCNELGLVRNLTGIFLSFEKYENVTVDARKFIKVHRTI